MSDKEIIKVTIEEFGRLQDYMQDADKNTNGYQAMLKRYIELKAILTALEVNVVELDRIKAV
ncbi:MAG: hypothetical protein IJ733_08330 [Lachnospiraceae bacterium]|nr:hypothetical protein [Lachnospiraceae bacterium]